MNQCQTQIPHVSIEPVVLAGSPTALPENIEPRESLKQNQTISYFSHEKDKGGGRVYSKMAIEDVRERTVAVLTSAHL